MSSCSYFWQSECCWSCSTRASSWDVEVSAMLVQRQGWQSLWEVGWRERENNVNYSKPTIGCLEYFPLFLFLDDEQKQVRSFQAQVFCQLFDDFGGGLQKNTFIPWSLTIGCLLPCKEPWFGFVHPYIYICFPYTCFLLKFFGATLWSGFSTFPHMRKIVDPKSLSTWSWISRTTRWWFN